MSWNLPDDFGRYWQRCEQCGARWHPGGEDCACETCESCGERAADLDRGVCEPCRTCSVCERYGRTDAPTVCAWTGERECADCHAEHACGECGAVPRGECACTTCTTCGLEGVRVAECD